MAVRERPDATLAELREYLGLDPSVQTLSRATVPAAYVEESLHAQEQDRADFAAQRAQWQAEMKGLDVQHLVFIDETWDATNMTRRPGRSPRGTRLVAKVPHGHRKTMAFIGAPRSDGLTVPTVIDGAVNAELFLAYV